MTYKALEFYSGIGGLHLALARSGVQGSVQQAFDWDPVACHVYSLNHRTDVTKIDIGKLTAPFLSAFHADLWLLSPACQPYTVLNPDAKGAADPRARSFLHLIENVLPEMAAAKTHPSHLLVENVGGFEASSTRQVVLKTLQELGYTTMEFLLTPLQFSIPNSRLRYYLLAKLDPSPFPDTAGECMGNIWRRIPGQCLSWLPPPGDSTSELSISQEARAIRQYLDDEHYDAVHPHAVPDKVLRKWGRLFDIVLPSSRRTCCFTRGYTQLVERSGSILQMNEELDTTVIFDQFLALQKSGDADAIHLLRPLGLRYFTPSELLRLFDFEPLVEDLRGVQATKVEWPAGLSRKTKYRLIGNSVNIRVVQELIKYLFSAPKSSRD
ncbi:S-adenosyl-L-methionine-dependent methyltransferase [Infundibulicybe gibba]|nr:S-adenosyl-L-methionine-dependent methyltransferase [Infundibulicybe gibba]